MLTNTSTLKNVHSKSPVTAVTPAFCSLTDTVKTVPSVYNKSTSKWSSKAQIWSKYIYYIPPSPQQQCNNSATVKFHMELLLTTTTRKQSGSGTTPKGVFHLLITRGMPQKNAWTIWLLLLLLLYLGLTPLQQLWIYHGCR